VERQNTGFCKEVAASIPCPSSDNNEIPFLPLSLAYMWAMCNRTDLSVVNRGLPNTSTQVPSISFITSSEPIERAGIALSERARNTHEKIVGKRAASVSPRAQEDAITKMEEDKHKAVAARSLFSGERQCDTA
jgi:hypothetical protein